MFKFSNAACPDPNNQFHSEAQILSLRVPRLRIRRTGHLALPFTSTNYNKVFPLGTFISSFAQTGQIAPVLTVLTVHSK